MQIIIGCKVSCKLKQSNKGRGQTIGFNNFAVDKLTNQIKCIVAFEKLCVEVAVGGWQWWLKRTLSVLIMSKPTILVQAE